MVDPGADASIGGMVGKILLISFETSISYFIIHLRIYYIIVFLFIN